MTVEQAIEIVETHSKWRRDNNVPPKTKMQNPKEIGEALDVLLIVAKDYCEIYNMDSEVLPKFCFLCGIRLDEIGLGWMQCANEKCGALFLPFKDIDGNQNLMLQRLEKDNK